MWVKPPVTFKRLKYLVSPTPPDVPRRNRTTSWHWAWCSSLMSSCSMMEMEGTPMPCCYINHRWTKYSAKSMRIIHVFFKEYIHLLKALVPLCTCSSDQFPHKCPWCPQGFRAASAPGAWTERKPSSDLHCHRHTRTIRNRDSGVGEFCCAALRKTFNRAVHTPWYLQTSVGGCESWCSGWSGRECLPP